VDEEDAAAKVRDEVERPYGFMGRWQTVSTDIEVLAEESTLPQAVGPIGDGPLLLSVKDAAKHLGVTYNAMYDLINRGEIEHLRLGRRMYVSRDAMTHFIEVNSHRGYWRP
jgi:excisionase family DNA binding protein